MCPCCREPSKDVLLFSKLIKVLVNGCAMLHHIVWLVFGTLEPEETPNVQQYVRAVSAITGLTRDQLKTMDPSLLRASPGLVEVCQRLGDVRTRVTNVEERWPNIASFKPRALLDALRDHASELLAQPGDDDFMALLNRVLP